MPSAHHWKQRIPRPEFHLGKASRKKVLHHAPDARAAALKDIRCFKENGFESGWPTVIVGVGIDLIENDRFEEELARADWCLADGIFVKGEIRHRENREQSSQWYAACFAAKEAALKALDISVANLAIFRDVELKRRSGSRYELDFHGRLKSRCDELGVKNVGVCIAHGKKLTIASVVLND